MVVLNYLLTQISFLTIKTNLFSTYVVLIQSLAAIISYKKLSCRWQTARRMCKCNDVADLTRVIKIRRKKIDSSNPAFQDHSTSLEPTRIDPPSMISY